LRDAWFPLRFAKGRHTVPPLAICNPIATGAKAIFSNSVPQPF
jgi:hypothetical protein